MRAFVGSRLAACSLTLLAVACGSDENRTRPSADAALDSGGVDAASADASLPDGAASPDTAPPGDAPGADVAAPRGLFVGMAGLDSNPGTREQPLKSIATALSRAMPGEYVWLLDGTFDETTDPRLGGGNAAGCGTLSGIVVPSGVTLAAANAGAATLSVSGSWGLCLAGGTVKDINFKHAPQTGRMIEALEGDNVIEGATFENAYCSGGSGWEAAVSAKNDARLTLRPGRTSNFLVSGCQFLSVFDKAVVTIEGGSVVGGTSGSTGGSSMIIVRDEGKLISKGTTFASTMHQYGISLNFQASLVLEPGTVVRGFSVAGILNRAQASTLQAAGATIEKCGNGIFLQFGYPSKLTATLTNSTFTMNTTGISAGFDSTVDLTLVGGSFNGNMTGVSLLSVGTVKVTGTEFSNNANKGLELASQKDCKLELRAGRITNNGGPGLNLNCSPSATIDLGTLASPGGNTLTGNVPSLATVGGLTFDAIGNTWTPSAQGADATGLYKAVGAGAVVEVTGGAGPNHQLGTSKVRVAQNP